MSFKVLTGKALLGGSAALRDAVVATAAGDLESKLNDGSVEKVAAVATYLTDSEFQLVAVVEVADKAKKGGK